MIQSLIVTENLEHHMITVSKGNLSTYSSCSPLESTVHIYFTFGLYMPYAHILRAIPRGLI